MSPEIKPSSFGRDVKYQDGGFPKVKFLSCTSILRTDVQRDVKISTPPQGPTKRIVTEELINRRQNGARRIETLMSQRTQESLRLEEWGSLRREERGCWMSEKGALFQHVRVVTKKRSVLKVDDEYWVQGGIMEM